jgi:hypothetical protein
MSDHVRRVTPRPRMSINYIANSTGVPKGDIFAAIGLPAADNQNKPLELLSREQRYPGGTRAPVDAIQIALEQRWGTL